MTTRCFVQVVEKVVHVDRPVEKVVHVYRPVEKVVHVDRPVEKVCLYSYIVLCIMYHFRVRRRWPVEKVRGDGALCWASMDASLTAPSSRWSTSTGPWRR
jgi:hypothetical protein